MSILLALINLMVIGMILLALVGGLTLLLQAYNLITDPFKLTGTYGQILICCITGSGAFIFGLVVLTLYVGRVSESVQWN